MKYTSYEILSIVPVSGMFAVHAQDSEIKGKYRLERTPLHFVAVAKATERTVEDGKRIDTEVLPNEVVGVQLSEGCFQVCDDDDNFAGLIHFGDDVNDLIFNLPSSYRDIIE